MDLKKVIMISGMFIGNACYASQDMLRAIFGQPINPDVLLNLGMPYLKNIVMAGLDLLSNPKFIAEIDQDEDTWKVLLNELALATKNQHISEVKKMKMSNGENLVNDTTPEELRASLERIRNLYNDPNTPDEVKTLLEDYVQSVADAVPGETRYKGVKDPDDVDDIETLVFANILYGQMTGENVTEDDVYSMWSGE